MEPEQPVKPFFELFVKSLWNTVYFFQNFTLFAHYFSKQAASPVTVLHTLQSHKVQQRAAAAATTCAIKNGDQRSKEPLRLILMLDPFVFHCFTKEKFAVKSRKKARKTRILKHDALIHLEGVSEEVDSLKSGFCNTFLIWD